MAKTDHRKHLRHPRLVDVVRDLIRDSGEPYRKIASRYGVSESFIQDLMRLQHCPRADICQRIYEDLTGRPLLVLEAAALNSNNPHRG